MLQAAVKNKTKQLIWPLVVLLLLIYFIYHLIEGERGVLAWVRLNKEVQEKSTKLTTLQEQMETLDNRVHLIRDESLDRDMLEEQIRRVLNYARSDELIVQEDRKN